MAQGAAASRYSAATAAGDSADWERPLSAAGAPSAGSRGHQQSDRRRGVDSGVSSSSSAAGSGAGSGSNSAAAARGGGGVGVSAIPSVPQHKLRPDSLDDFAGGLREALGAGPVQGASSSSVAAQLPVPHKVSIGVGVGDSLLRGQVRGPCRIAKMNLGRTS